MPRSGYGLWGMLALAGAAAVLAVSDNEWEWRDTLRRVVEGEAMPAFRAYEWADAGLVREKLAEGLLASELSSSPAEQNADTCRDLALHALIVAAGESTISRGGLEMGKLMEELGLDVDWLEDIVYFCPMEYAESALPLLAHIYRSEPHGMADAPVNRRLAAAVAFEFARAGLSKEAAHAHYLYYAASGQKSQLNSSFPQLAIWELGALASRGADATWGGKGTLNWFQRNLRLPAQGYVRAGDALGAHEKSLFGVEVDSPAFRTLYQDAAMAGPANLYKESGCSTELIRAHYAATAACANGVPSIVASGGAEAACLVDVNGQWEFSDTLPDNATCSWRFMGYGHPDFVRLASRLGADRGKYIASARLAQMGQFHYDAGNRPLSSSFYREAVKQQPLNFAAWQGYLAAGAGKEELQQAAAHFAELPGVAAVLAGLAGN